MLRIQKLEIKEQFWKPLKTCIYKLQTQTHTYKAKVTLKCTSLKELTSQYFISFPNLQGGFLLSDHTESKPGMEKPKQLCVAAPSLQQKKLHTMS